MHRRLFFILLYVIAGTLQALAGPVKGRVADQTSHEPLIGATVVLEEKGLHDISGLDGSFIIKNAPAGTYHLSISLAGYKTLVKEVTISGDAPLNIDIDLEADHDKTLHEVVVAGKTNHATEGTARQIERNAPQVMNVVSGQAIRLSPDLTVANVIQRMSGISIERNSNGDGQYAILRGMDKRYNYTLVNGVKIPSPDDKYRYVPLDIFPSELLDRLEVYKALTPSMEGDAVGGAVNMVMKDAPDHLSVEANIGTGYNELFFDRDFLSFNKGAVNFKSPYELRGNQYNATAADFNNATSDYSTRRPMPNLIGGLSIGNRFLNDRLGVIIAGSYQHTYRGSNSLFFDTDKRDTLSGVVVTSMEKRAYSEEQLRYGLHAKLDYRINSRNSLQLYNAYMRLTNTQVRDAVETELSIGDYDPDKGNATLGYKTRSRITQQQIYNSTLQGDHRLADKLLLQWSAVYSKATQTQPDNTTIPLFGIQENFVQQRTNVGDATRRWEHNSDRDLAGYLNLTWNKPVASLPVEWKIGGLYRDKQRDNFYNNYQFHPQNLQAQYGVDFTDYKDIAWALDNPRGSVGSALNYTAFEKTGAGYLQFKVSASHLEVTGGARAEHTDQGYAMKAPIGEDNPTGHQVYTDVLPSLHFRFMPWDKTNIRASYFRSVNRPGFSELVPGPVVREEYRETGNPDLKHAIADNIDLRYEFFPRATEQFMAGVFYKHIKDPIEFTLQLEPRSNFLYYMPGNFGNANNYGLELDFIKYVKQFGIKANYTYTHSSITTPKTIYVRTAANNGDIFTSSADETRPLYGQAAHTGNLTLLYKSGRYGWDVQLAGNYTGERIVVVSQYLGDDQWQKGFVQMDFSLEKSLGHFGIFAKANNLLNTPMEVYVRKPYTNSKAIPYQSPDGRVLIRRDYYQRTYLLGARYKF
ncbi:outer membrane beta-barrel protein [Chitinophaga agrisoli]|uniref:Outer membrane beta-barrel protein n=1 Tax=Chitinophaga agrisoli TaxID=2607653 RepID=A0A5B2VJE5_9BACT|nr:TonB-dependent receptor [Chitinophaga agrisoli]KAA2238670.1 outer membrane beta-barrel protein [Chitinophaga agrisoli]